MKLSELQKKFADHLYNKNNKIFSAIKPGKITPEKRLQIYRNNVFGNFDAVLESIFEVTKKIIGDEEFENLAKKYHQKYSSKSGNLNDYGRYFPRLISLYKKDQDSNFLSELAEMEWLYHCSYFAKDSKKINLEKLQNLSEEKFFKLTFKLHPSCHLIKSNYQLCSIWQHYQKNSRKKNFGKKTEYILIERVFDNCEIHGLSQEEYQFLEQVKQSKNIYKIYQNLSKKNPKFDIGTLINKYVSGGILAGFVVG